MKASTLLLFGLWLVTSFYWIKSTYTNTALSKENNELKIIIHKCDSINNINTYRFDSQNKVNENYSYQFNQLIESHRKATKHTN